MFEIFPCAEQGPVAVLNDSGDEGGFLSLSEPGAGMRLRALGKEGRMTGPGGHTAGSILSEAVGP